MVAEDAFTRKNVQCVLPMLKLRMENYVSRLDIVKNSKKNIAIATVDGILYYWNADIEIWIGFVMCIFQSASALFWRYYETMVSGIYVRIRLRHWIFLITPIVLASSAGDVSSVTCIVIPHIDKVNRDGSGFAIGTAVIWWAPKCPEVRFCRQNQLDKAGFSCLF